MRLPLAATAFLTAALLAAPIHADTVVLKNGSKISGEVREVENEPMILIKLDFGHIVILKTEIDRIERDGEEEKPAPAADADKIETTHVIHFKTGAQLRGNLVSGDDDALAYIEVAGLGRMAIDRARIDRIEESAGEIEIPAAPAPRETEPVDEEPAEDEAEEPKIGDLTLTELADLLLFRTRAAVSDLQYDPDLALTIDNHVRELGRHRTRNRVRAERHLRNIGPAALPYLTPVANHPFNLPRRAVQRIVRDIGAIEGAPIAIAGLDDEDRFVRATAHEALVRMFPERIRYKASWSPSRRRSAQLEYEALWAAREREAILSTLREVLGVPEPEDE